MLALLARGLSSFPNLFSQSCFLCGNAQADIVCADCLRTLPRPPACACPRCGNDLPTAAALCGNCMRQPTFFSQTHALLRYEPPVDQLILAAKFNAHLTLLAFLGRRMAEQAAHWPRPDALIPVPMHPNPLRARGFNQAVLLARPIARRLGLPLSLTTVRCVRKKQQQSLLSAAERVRNVRGIFTSQPLPQAWRHVAVVDDVMTTGATANEMAKILLRQGGVAQVSVWCCART